MTITQFDEVASRVEGAADYFACFGEAADDPVAHVKREYRRMARAVHTDVVPEHQHGHATVVFDRLKAFYQQALDMAGEGKYGQPIELIVWTSRVATHRVTDVLGRGDLCATYGARTVLRGGDERLTFCKVVKAPADNDLMQIEADVLKRLRGTDMKDKLHPFFPKLLDSFEHWEKGKSARRVNVLARLNGFYNLAQVRQAFPAGLSSLHATWIWRRILYALGHAHSQAVHGAVLPEHIMILPEQHGLILVDWCYASPKGDTGGFAPVKAIVGVYKDWYPDEVLTKQPPGPATDIVMAARCMIELMGGDPLTGNFAATSHVPRQFRAFFKGCLSKSKYARPQDALGLLTEFDQLLQDMGEPYYPRKFRPFTMPTGVV